MVRAIYRGLAANDCVFFQTQRDAQNFLAGALRALRGARRVYDRQGDLQGLIWQDRTIWVRAHPIALDAAPVRAQARLPEATAQAERIAEQLHLDEDHQLIVRVDRVEPTKNIVRGFLAYERLLKLHPKLKGQVTFLALLVPSRESLAAYRTYAAQVERTIARINAQYGTASWQPIVALVDNDQARALACMRRYDVLLVNPIIDGMNLVVKEGGLVNNRAGVIVLARTAGAYEQLGSDTVNVAPTDITGTADALYQALTMSRRERMRRARGIRAVLRAESAEQWLDAQLTDLALAAKRANSAARLARQAAVDHPRVARKPSAKVTLLRPRGERGELSATQAR
jgi:trehalose 6-phosphate synthase